MKKHVHFRFGYQSLLIAFVLDIFFPRTTRKQLKKDAVPSIFSHSKKTVERPLAVKLEQIRQFNLSKEKYEASVRDNHAMVIIKISAFEIYKVLL